MTTQTRRVTEQPLNLVLRPDSPAEAAFRSAMLPPASSPPRPRARVPRRPDARSLAYRLVYLGGWAGRTSGATSTAR